MVGRAILDEFLNLSKHFAGELMSICPQIEAEQRMGGCNRTTTQRTEVNQQQKKIRLLAWPSQSTDLSPNQVLWQDLKWRIRARHPNNNADLKQFRKEELSKIPPDCCAGLICNYRGRLLRLLLLKEGQSIIKSKGSHREQHEVQNTFYGQFIQKSR